MSVAEETEPITLPQVVARLKALEAQISTIHIRTPQIVEEIEYVIRVDGGEVWHGHDVDVQYPEIRQAHPNARVSIGWRSNAVFLI